MFVCYFTYCKNNRHNHSPTWKFFTTLKIVTFPVSAQFQTPVMNNQCFSPGVWFSLIYTPTCYVLLGVPSPHSLKVCVRADAFSPLLLRSCSFLLWRRLLPVKSISIFQSITSGRQSLSALWSAVWGRGRGWEAGCRSRSPSALKGSLRFSMRTRGVQMQTKSNWARTGESCILRTVVCQCCAWAQGRDGGWGRQKRMGGKGSGHTGLRRPS